MCVCIDVLQREIHDSDPTEWFGILIDLQITNSPQSCMEGPEHRKFNLRDNYEYPRIIQIWNMEVTLYVPICYVLNVLFVYVMVDVTIVDVLYCNAYGPWYGMCEMYT